MEIFFKDDLIFIYHNWGYQLTMPDIILQMNIVEMNIYPSDDSCNVNSSCSIGFFTQVPSCSTLNAFHKIFLFFCERKMNKRNYM